jgi:hypothetical protein
MTLLPTPLKRSAFVHALELTCPYNLLVDKVARDVEWIYGRLEGVLEHVSRMLVGFTLVGVVAKNSQCGLGLHRMSLPLGS